LISESPRGDLDCDQSVTPADLTPFVATLIDPDAATVCHRYTADLNADGQNDALDIPAFVSCLLAGCP